MVKVALLDDYQDVARSMADWSRLPAGSEVRAFQDHLAEEDALVQRLRDFDIIVAMRERTPFPRSLVQRLPNAEGPPLCTLGDFDYPTERRQLAEGDCLCVVSDGITEAMNERDELYGAHRLEHVLKFIEPGAAPAAIVSAVRADVRGFVGAAIASDDLTLLALRWTPAGRAPQESTADVDLDAAVAGLLDPVPGRH